jgi:hypothetical protein
MNIAVMPFAECAPLLLNAGHEPAEVRDLPCAVHEPGVGSHHAPKDLIRDHGLSHDPLAAGPEHVDLRALLVGGEVRLEEVVLDGVVVRLDPPAGGLCRFPRQVLAGGVAGGVVEARVEDAAGGVLLDLHEPA